MDPDPDARPTVPPGPSPEEGSRAAARLARLLGVLQKALAHELPNVLVGVQGLARLLELDEAERLSAEGREYLGRVAAGAGKAHALVTDLAELARLARPVPPAEPVDLAEVAAEALAEAKHLAPGRPAEYHGPQHALLLSAPRAALRKVLVLLLRRAGGADTGERPLRVELTTRAIGTEAEIRVADNGPAIRPQAIDQLFEPFTGADGSRMDLFLVRQLAEDWGGAVRVESYPGTGNVFIVTCPLSV